MIAGAAERAALLRPPLARAARYRFLAALLEPPRPGRQAALRALAVERPPGEGPDLAPALAPDDWAVEASHFRLLGQAGCVPSCASDYVEGGFADKGPILADIAGFYRAFGFEPEPREAPDHFAALLSFLAALALKQAYAALAEDAEQVEVARDAERAFLATHVSPYLGRFALRLAAAAPPGGPFAAIAAAVARLDPARP